MLKAYESKVNELMNPPSTHSLQNIITLDLLSLFELSQGDLAQTHTAYLQSFTLTRGADAGETAEFMMMLHSHDTDAVLWWVPLSLGPNETFEATLNTVYEESMYFRASPLTGPTGRMEFEHTMRIHSVLVSEDGQGAKVTPTLSVSKALNATQTNMTLQGSYSSVKKDFSGTLLCDVDANVSVTTMLGSVTALGADLSAHMASNAEGPIVLVVPCLKGSAVVASCTAPCSLQWDGVLLLQDGSSSGVIVLIAGCGAVVVIVGLIFLARTRKSMTHAHHKHLTEQELAGEELAGEELEEALA